jgi:hypothetical protein
VQYFPKKREKKPTKNGQSLHTNHEMKNSPKMGIVEAINVSFLVKTSK